MIATKQLGQRWRIHFNNSYNSNHSNDDNDKDNNVDRFKEINESKIEELHKHNENNDNKIEPNNDKNINQAGVPEENINQAGVPQAQLPAIPEQPEPDDRPHIIEDKPVTTANNDNRPNYDRRNIEHLTYDILGKTHQQSDAQNTHPNAILEQCHNIDKLKQRDNKRWAMQF